MTVNYFLPNKNFNSILPSFLSTPDLLVGMPVSLANLDLAAVMPKALFHEKENPKFLAMGCLFRLNRIQINGCECFSKYNWFSANFPTSVYAIANGSVLSKCSYFLLIRFLMPILYWKYRLVKFSTKQYNIQLQRNKTLEVTFRESIQ